MIWGVVKAIASALFGWIGSLVASWFQRREDRAQGAKDQAAAETASTARVEAQEAQAEADAPKTDQAIDDRLEKGTF